MNKRDQIITGACILQLCVCVAVAAKVLLYKQSTAPPAQLADPTLTTASPTITIGDHPTYLGNSKAPFTLVEFGDFQCPPCEVADPKVKKALKKFGQDDLRFTFRNLPLTHMHPFAENAAIAAERARIEGKYWPVHDAFYKLGPSINDAAIARILTAAGVSNDPTKVAAETKIAKATISREFLLRLSWEYKLLLVFSCVAAMAMS